MNLESLDLSLLPWLLLILAAEFVNGWTDAPNAIATVVSTRVLRPHHALLMAAVLNTLGALSGTAVAATTGKGIIKAEAIDIQTVGAAKTGAGLMILLASHLGIPLSTTHTINTSIMGVGATRRLSAVRWGVAGTIALAWVLTFPVCGVIAYLAASILR